VARSPLDGVSPGAGVFGETPKTAVETTALPRVTEIVLAPGEGEDEGFLSSAAQNNIADSDSLRLGPIDADSGRFSRVEQAPIWLVLAACQAKRRWGEAPPSRDILRAIELGLDGVSALPKGIPIT